MSKLIKEAERNVINQAKYYTDLIGVLDDLQHGVLRTLDSHSPGREKITEGFNQVRQGVYSEMQFALARCFCIVGIGGEEAVAYSREQAKRIFDGRHTTMEWLDNWHRLPSSWLTSEAEAFEAELKEALK
jgi:hypothetical protein